MTNRVKSGAAARRSIDGRPSPKHMGGRRVNCVTVPLTINSDSLILLSVSVTASTV